MSRCHGNRYLKWVNLAHGDSDITVVGLLLPGIVCGPLLPGHHMGAQPQQRQYPVVPVRQYNVALCKTYSQIMWADRGLKAPNGTVFAMTTEWPTYPGVELDDQVGA